MFRKPILFLFVNLLIVACSSPQTDKSEKTETRPNVILFLTDDNDFSYWGFGGGPKLSPNIDRLASEGLVANQFYVSSSVCTPSRYSLHTGKYAGKCSAKEFFDFNPTDKPYKITWNTPLDPEVETTLGEVFQQAGYKTGVVGKWHLSFRIPRFEFDAEADPADPAVAQKLLAYQQASVEQVKLAGFDYAASIIPGNNDEHPVHQLRVHNLEWTAKGAIDFLNEQKDSDQPFLLLVNISTHHGPCHRSSIESDIRLTQQGLVEGLEGIMPARNTIAERITAKGLEVDFKTAGTVWTDDCVGTIMDHVKNLSMAENTAVVFTTDHNRYDGKGTCYQGGVHIPFVMKYPGQQARTVDTRFQIIDLMPTLMDACKIEAPSNMKIDGKSAWSMLSDSEIQTDGSERDFYFEFGYTRAVLAGDWKYIAFRPMDDQIQQMQEGKVDRAFNFKGNTGDEPAVLRYPHYFDRDQLYNIKLDPEEQKNLANDPAYQETLNMMKAKLISKLDGFQHPFPVEQANPFFNTEKYRLLAKNAKILNMDQHYWYKNGCY